MVCRYGAIALIEILNTFSKQIAALQEILVVEKII